MTFEVILKCQLTLTSFYPVNVSVITLKWYHVRTLEIRDEKFMHTFFEVGKKQRRIYELFIRGFKFRIGKFGTQNLGMVNLGHGFLGL